MLKLLLTVGSQMPFDRLTRAVAAWARTQTRFQTQALEITAQVGLSALPPEATWPLNCRPTLSPMAYRQACEACDLIVAHAGMGSILTAMELQRPLVVMPRRGHLRETRNDHQLHTAQALLQNGPAHINRPLSNEPSSSAILVALDEHALPGLLDRACASLQSPSNDAQALKFRDIRNRPASIQPARQQLIESVRHIIQSQSRPAIE